MREGSLDAPIRHPIDWQAEEWSDPAALDATLRELVGRGLLFFERDNARFDLHPVIRPRVGRSGGAIARAPSSRRRGCGPRS